MYSTHTLIKWRTNIYEPFKYYTKIPIEYVKQYVGPFAPYNGQQVAFRIVDNIPTILLPFYDGKTQEIHFLKMQEHFYLIDGNLLLAYNPNYPVALLKSENITHFRIGDNPWQPIANVSYYNQYCIVSEEQQFFTEVGVQNKAFRFVLPNDVISESLVEKSFEEFIPMIEVHNYIIQ